MEYIYVVTAAAAIPCTIFGGMMLAAAAALKANGESPRAVLAMPRTIIRRGELSQRVQSSGDRG